MAHDVFIDVMEGGLGEYTLPISHESEEPDKNTLNLQRTAPTTGVGYVRQQGSPSPKVKVLKGWIVQKAQFEKMEAFYNACAGIGTPRRTVTWKDIDGTEHEVIITDWEPLRQVGRAGGTHLGYVWTYTLTMELIT